MQPDRQPAGFAAAPGYGALVQATPSAGSGMERAERSGGIRPYYCAGGVTIYHGKAEELLEQLPMFDLMLTDPPYPGFEKGWDIPDVSAILGNIRARKKLVFWGVLLPAPLAGQVAVHVWEKPNGSLSHQWEPIYAYGAATRISRVFRVATILPNYTQFKAECEDHPTQKPLKLIRKLIAQEKPLSIVDPFLGSGTTLAAAKELGIAAVGIEQNEAFCEMSARRLQQECLSLGGGGAERQGELLSAAEKRHNIVLDRTPKI